MTHICPFCGLPFEICQCSIIEEREEAEKLSHFFEEAGREIAYVEAQIWR